MLSDYNQSNFSQDNKKLTTFEVVKILVSCVAIFCLIGSIAIMLAWRG